MVRVRIRYFELELLIRPDITCRHVLIFLDMVCTKVQRFTGGGGTIRASNDLIYLSTFLVVSGSCGVRDIFVRNNVELKAGSCCVAGCCIVL